MLERKLAWRSKTTRRDTIPPAPPADLQKQDRSSFALWGVPLDSRGRNRRNSYRTGVSPLHGDSSPSVLTTNPVVDDHSMPPALSSHGAHGFVAESSLVYVEIANLDRARSSLSSASIPGVPWRSYRLDRAIVANTA